MFWVIATVNLAFQLYSIVIILRVLLPWLGIHEDHPVLLFLIRIADPVLALVRRFVRPKGGLDISPLVALIILWVLRLIVVELLQLIGRVV